MEREAMAAKAVSTPPGSTHFWKSGFLRLREGRVHSALPPTAPGDPGLSLTGAKPVVFPGHLVGGRESLHFQEGPGQVT